jgi:hypothetical protein
MARKGTQVGAWLEWMIFPCLVTWAIAQILGKAWCLLQLRRHWRSAPELWGIDWLDIVFRLEREFGVRLTGTDFAQFSAHERITLTAGQLWKVVAGKRQNGGNNRPKDGWERVVTTLGEALNVDSERVLPSSRLYADLGMFAGID